MKRTVHYYNLLGLCSFNIKVEPPFTTTSLRLSAVFVQAPVPHIESIGPSLKRRLDSRKTVGHRQKRLHNRHRQKKKCLNNNNRIKWMQALCFTYREPKAVNVANTPSGRNEIAFKDNFL